MTTQFAVKSAGPSGIGSSPVRWICAAAMVLLAGVGWVPGTRAADAAKTGGTTRGETGPTLRLDYGRGEASGSPVATFMYFVPLISPDPVTAVTSAGSTQKARVTSAERRQSSSSFSTICEFEFVGEGSQQSLFDLTREIHRHELKLKAGGTLGRQLRSITVAGPGRGRVEIEGAITNGVSTVSEVRLRFNAHGQTSPVSIGLCDVRHLDGDFRLTNEIVARVNTLTFRRKAGPPKMEVTVASVKKKGAGNGLWQNLKGSLKGAAVNMLISPLTVDRVGHRTMLEFGQALTLGSTNFTFPRAKNLKEALELPADNKVTAALPMPQNPR